MWQYPISKISQKKQVETSNTPAQSTPKETIIEPKNVVNESGNNSNLGKDKS